MEAVLIILFAFLSFCYIYRKAILTEGNCSAYETEKTTPSYKILAVRNNEDCIEGVIYKLIKEMQLIHNRYFVPQIIVIDLGSQDNTLKILEKLSEKYDFIKILHGDSYINMVSSI